jgi:hypothetical protein
MFVVLFLSIIDNIIIYYRIQNPMSMYAKFFSFKSLAPNIKMSLVMFLAQVSINTYHFSTASQI